MTTINITSEYSPTTIALEDTGVNAYCIIDNDLYHVNWAEYNMVKGTFTCVRIRDFVSLEFSVKTQVIPVKVLNISYTI